MVFVLFKYLQKNMKGKENEASKSTIKNNGILLAI